MKINVAELIKNDSKHIVIDEKCNGFTVEDDYVVLSPVSMNGELWYESGVIKFEFIILYTAKALCARCLSECDVPIALSVDDEISTEDVIEAYGTDIDTEELLKDQIILNMPLRVICSPDCKGLCSKCGCNLNTAICDCIHDEYSNPQFASLTNWQNESGKD